MRLREAAIERNEIDHSCRRDVGWLVGLPRRGYYLAKQGDEEDVFRTQRSLAERPKIDTLATPTTTQTHVSTLLRHGM